LPFVDGLGKLSKLFKLSDHPNNLTCSEASYAD